MASPQNEDLPVTMPGHTTASQRLWSEEVGIAAAADDVLVNPKDPGYLFSNGRRFDNGPAFYEQS